MLSQTDRERINTLHVMIKKMLADDRDMMRVRRTLREAGEMVTHLVNLIEATPDQSPVWVSTNPQIIDLSLPPAPALRSKRAYNRRSAA